MNRMMSGEARWGHAHSRPVTPYLEHRSHMLPDPTARSIILMRADTDSCSRPIHIHVRSRSGISHALPASACPISRHCHAHPGPEGSIWPSLTICTDSPLLTLTLTLLLSAFSPNDSHDIWAVGFAKQPHHLHRCSHLASFPHTHRFCPPTSQPIRRAAAERRRGVRRHPSSTAFTSTNRAS